MHLRKFSAQDGTQKDDSQSKRFKFSDFSDNDKKLFLISNCRLFDATYLEFLNVLKPPSSKNPDSQFKDASFEMFFPSSESQDNISQSPLASLLRFVKAIDFFSAFEEGKVGSWIKLLNFFGIVSQKVKIREKGLKKFAKDFELDEDSLILNFKYSQIHNDKIYLSIWCNFLQFLSSFHFKSIIIRDFYGRDEEFEAITFLLWKNQNSLVCLEFENDDFRKCNQNELKLHFPNLEKITIVHCFEFEKLAISFGKSLFS